MRILDRAHDGISAVRQTSLLADLTWKPGHDTEISERRAAWNRARTSVEVFALNAARLGAVALLVEVAVGVARHIATKTDTDD